MTNPKIPPALASTSRIAAINELKRKVSDQCKELEKLTSEIEQVTNLPLIHGSLLAKVNKLSRALFFMQVNLCRPLNEASVAKEIEILEADLESLKTETKTDKELV